jgi:stage III sporulation protein AB
MFKWVGSILIVISGTGMGRAKARQLKIHLEQLEEVRKCVFIIKSEMQHTRSTFETIFEEISTKQGHLAGKWLMEISQELKKQKASSFVEIWEEITKSIWGNSYLNEEEVTELQRLGKNLEYTECLETYLEQLEYNINQRREEYEKKMKIYQCLGITGGIFLAVVLL